MRIVDFPAPDGPTSATVLPGGTSTVTPCRAIFFSSYEKMDVRKLNVAVCDLERFCIVRIGDVRAVVDDREHPFQRRQSMLQVLRSDWRGCAAAGKPRPMATKKVMNWPIVVSPWLTWKPPHPRTRAIATPARLSMIG